MNNYILKDANQRQNTLAIFIYSFFFKIVAFICYAIKISFLTFIYNFIYLSFCFY